MKTILAILVVAVLVGCVSSDPLMTGKPQDWQGKPASDLKAALGEPMHVITASNGDEIWEYHKANDVVIPKGENMSFGFAGLGSSAGGAGGFSSEKRPEDRISRVENLYRFKIRGGKVREWYAARIMDGRIVWEDH